MTTTTPTSGPFNLPTVVAVNPLSTDIDWDEVERTLGILILQSRLQREDVRNGASEPRPKSHPIRSADEPIASTSPASIEQALASARLHLDEAATNLDLAISGPGVAPNSQDARSVQCSHRSASQAGSACSAGTRERPASTDRSADDPSSTSATSATCGTPGHSPEHYSCASPSSVAGCSEGTGSAGSASDDPAKHRGRFADPSRSLTDHLEDLIRVDEILARSFPRATSSDRIKTAVEILSVLRWESQAVPIGPDLATADDVIAGRARYADTPGGHADRKTLRGEKAPIIHLVYPDGPVLTAACGQSIDGRGHTGHYAGDVKHDLDWGRNVCLACVQLLETP